MLIGRSTYLPDIPRERVVSVTSRKENAPRAGDKRRRGLPDPGVIPAGMTREGRTRDWG